MKRGVGYRLLVYINSLLILGLLVALLGVFPYYIAGASDSILEVGTVSAVLILLIIRILRKTPDYLKDIYLFNQFTDTIDGKYRADELIVRMVWLTLANILSLISFMCLYLSTSPGWINFYPDGLKKFRK